MWKIKNKDALFAPYGHLRRIKIYRDSHGKPKGDALITYAKPGSTTAAINKLNGHVFAAQHSLTLSRADFSYKEEGANVHEGLGFDDHLAHPAQEEDEQEDYEALPAECEADRYPVVILRNVYDPNETADEVFADLEADMLQECVRHGEVKKILSPEGDYYAGCVAVVFATFEAAHACAKAMHGRFFDGRQIEVEMQGKVETDKVIGTRIGGGEEKEQDRQEEKKEGEGGGDEEGGEGVDIFLKSLEG